MSTTIPERLLSLDEVAEIFQCTRRHVENVIASGELASVLVGRLRRVPRASIEKYLEDRQRAATGISFDSPYWRAYLARYAKRLEAGSVDYLTDDFRARFLAVMKYLLSEFRLDASQPRPADHMERVERVNDLVMKLTEEHLTNRFLTPSGSPSRKLTRVSQILSAVLAYLGKLQEESHVHTA